MGTELGAREFDHVLVLFVDGEDCAAVQVAADWVEGDYLTADYKLDVLAAGSL